MPGRFTTVEIDAIEADGQSAPQSLVLQTIRTKLRIGVSVRPALGEHRICLEIVSYDAVCRIASEFPAMRAVYRRNHDIARLEEFRGGKLVDRQETSTEPSPDDDPPSWEHVFSPARATD